MRAVMAEHGITPAEWARRAGFRHATQIYNVMSGRTRSLGVPVLERLANVFPGLTVDQLSGRAPLAGPLPGPEPTWGLVNRARVVNGQLVFRESARSAAGVVAKLIAELGVWRSSVEATDESFADLPFLTDVGGKMLVRVADEHANDRIPRDAIVTVEDISQPARGLRHGSFALVEQTLTINAETLVECTLRRVVQREGNMSLVVATNLPKLQRPEIVVPSADGEEGWDEGAARIRIAGMAVAMTVSLLPD